MSSIFISGIIEFEYEGVKFLLKPLTGYEKEILSDLASQLEQELGKPNEKAKQKFVLNNAEFRLRKLKFALAGEGAGWDAKDTQGNPVPVNDESIKKLRTDVWDALAEMIDEISELTPGEEGNLAPR